MVREAAPALLDPEMGRQTWGLFREAGVDGPDGSGTPAVRAVVPVETDGTALRECFTLSVEAVGSTLRKKGELPPDEHEALVEETRQIEQDPDRLTAAYTVYSVWGRA
jgi:hypothetical protein